MARTAVVAGVGPGLGASLARRFADEGCSVGLVARSSEFVETLAAEIDEDRAGEATAVQADVGDPEDVAEAFATVREAFGPVDVLVNHASSASWTGLLEQSPAAFERAWRTAAYGGLLCSREAVPDMLDGDGGTVIFTGATSAIRGRGGAVGFSSAKFAVRGLAESMARELGPEGIHVAHVIVDGQILTPSAREAHPDRPAETFLDPDSIADSYWHLIEQDRSAWTLELDLRPHVEEF